MTGSPRNGRFEEALNTAFRQRTMEDLDALMASVKPADLNISELIGVVALLRAAEERRAVAAKSPAQLLTLVTPAKGARAK